jgi:hypothetical protein
MAPVSQCWAHCAATEATIFSGLVKSSLYPILLSDAWFMGHDAMHYILIQVQMCYGSFGCYFLVTAICCVVPVALFSTLCQDMICVKWKIMYSYSISLFLNLLAAWCYPAIVSRWVILFYFPCGHALISLHWTVKLLFWPVSVSWMVLIVGLTFGWLLLCRMDGRAYDRGLFLDWWWYCGRWPAAAKRRRREWCIWGEVGMLPWCWWTGEVLMKQPQKGDLEVGSWVWPAGRKFFSSWWFYRWWMLSAVGISSCGGFIFL